MPKARILTFLGYRSCTLEQRLETKARQCELATERVNNYGLFLTLRDDSLPILHHQPGTCPVSGCTYVCVCVRLCRFIAGRQRQLHVRSAGTARQHSGRRHALHIHPRCVYNRIISVYVRFRNTPWLLSNSRTLVHVALVPGRRFNWIIRLVVCVARANVLSTFSWNFRATFDVSREAFNGHSHSQWEYEKKKHRN